MQPFPPRASRCYMHAVLHAALQGMCIGLVPGVLRRFSVRCRKGPPSGDTGPVTQVVTQIYARSGAPHSGRRRQTGAPRPRRRTRAAGKGALAPIGCAGHVRGAGARPLGGRPPARVQKRPGDDPPPPWFDTSPSRPDRPSRPGSARGNGLPALARVCAGATELPRPRKKHSSSVTLLVQGVNRGCNQGSIIQPEILCIMYYTYYLLYYVLLCILY